MIFLTHDKLKHPTSKYSTNVLINIDEARFYDDLNELLIWVLNSLSSF